MFDEPGYIIKRKMKQRMGMTTGLPKKHRNQATNPIVSDRDSTSLFNRAQEEFPDYSARDPGVERLRATFESLGLKKPASREGSAISGNRKITESEWNSIKDSDFKSFSSKTSNAMSNGQMAAN